MGEQCPAHCDLEERVRELEKAQVVALSEEKHMVEKMNEITASLKQTAEALEALKIWQLKITLGTGAVASCAVFLVSHWSDIAGLLK